MTLKAELGKIRSVRFGYGGYQDAMFGVSFDLGGKSWGVGDFWGTWADDPDKGCKWTKEDQSKIFAETTRKLRNLMQKADKQEITKLVGVPVEVVFDGQKLKSWRVLEEVV